MCIFRRSPKPGCRFSLPELLAVIAVCAVFCALLLPVLAGARTRAMDTLCANHLTQLSAGVTLYAHDHDETLPQGPDRRFLPNTYAGNRHDLYPVAAEYEFLAYTGHPATGAAPWTDPREQPGPAFHGALWSSWFYFPGWDRLGAATPALRLEASLPGQVMFQDGLFRDVNGIRERVAHSRPPAERDDGGRWGQPSMCFFIPASRRLVTGHHLSRYDGSVERRDIADAWFLSTIHPQWRIGCFRSGSSAPAVPPGS